MEYWHEPKVLIHYQQYVEFYVQKFHFVHEFMASNAMNNSCLFEIGVEFLILTTPVIVKGFDFAIKLVRNK